MSIFDEVPEGQPQQKPADGPGIGGQVLKSASKAAGVLFGTANAPLAFIRGMMNAPTHSPEEWDKLSPIVKPIVMLGGGLESAGRSAFKEGDWGETYDTYYQNKTNSTLEKDFPVGAGAIRLGLDFLNDPLFGPAIVADLGKLGVKSVGEFGRYIAKGTIPLGAKQMLKLPPQVLADIKKLDSLEAAERVAAKQSVAKGLIDALNAQADKLAGLEKAHNATPIDNPLVLYDPAATASLLDANPGLDDYSKSLLRAMDTPQTSVAGERAASPMFQGKTVPVSLEDSAPELVKDLENFIERGKGGNKWIWKEEGTLKAGAGLAAGIEEDDEGNLAYDIKKGLLGTMAVAGGVQFLGKSRAAKQPGGIFTKLMNANPTAQITQRSKDIWALFDLQAEEMARRTAMTWDKIKGTFVNLTYDIAGNIKAKAKEIDPLFGKELQMRQELVAGASTRASNMIQQYNGMIFDGLSGDEKTILDQIIRSKSNAAIDIDKGAGAVKHSGGYTGAEYQQSIDDLEKILPKEVFADLSARADLFGEAMAEQLKMRLDEGLLTPAAYQSLSTRYYSPRQFLQYLEDQHIGIQGKITVPEKHIKKLEGGSEEFLWNDNRDLMAQTVFRTQDLIFKNRANNALRDFAQANPGNEIAQEAKVLSYTKAGAPVYEAAPAGYQSVGVFVNGERQPIFMKNQYADEWIKNDPLHNSMVIDLLSWLSGTKLVKLLATGINPLFALRNIPRDLSLIYMQADSPYSKIAPYAMGQMAGDMATVARDVFKRTGRVQDFINEGGGTALQTYYGRFSGEGFIGEKLQGFEKYAGWAGETSELWTRLALRERSLKSGMAPEAATWAARKYMDFSQGGSLVKALDIGMPYLNARIQGTRSLFRAAKEDPAAFAWKIGNLWAMSAGLYLANQMTNPEAWRQVSDRDKVSSFIITTPLSYKDSEGQTRHYTFKIAKSDEQQVATTFIDALLSRVHEGKYPTQQVLMSIGQLAGLGSFPPTMAALMAYAGNIDSWSWQDAWKGPENIEAGEQYTADTHPAVRALGKIGVSPDKAGVALGKLIPPNNFFVGLAGGGLAAILNQFDPPEKQKLTEELIMGNPAARTILSSTAPANEYRLEHKNLITAETTRRYRQTRELDDMMGMYFRDRNPEQAEKMTSFIEAQPEADQERLIGRVERYSQTAQLPDRKWWVEVGQMPYQARAQAFLLRFDKESPENQMRMVGLTEKISGFQSDDFINALTELRGGTAQ